MNCFEAIPRKENTFLASIASKIIMRKVNKGPVIAKCLDNNIIEQAKLNSRLPFQFQVSVSFLLLAKSMSFFVVEILTKIIICSCLTLLRLECPTLS